MQMYWSIDITNNTITTDLNQEYSWIRHNTNQRLDFTMLCDDIKKFKIQSYEIWMLEWNNKKGLYYKLKYKFAKKSFAKTLQW